MYLIFKNYFNNIGLNKINKAKRHILKFEETGLIVKGSILYDFFEFIKEEDIECQNMNNEELLQVVKLHLFEQLEERKKVSKVISHNERRWTKEKIKKVAASYKTIKEFRESNIQAYQAAISYKIKDEVCSHMKKDKTPWGFWRKNTKEKILERIGDCKTYYEFRTKFTKEFAAAKAYNRRGILISELKEEFKKREHGMGS